MKLQVLGTGCPKCNKLAELSERVAREQNLKFHVGKSDGYQRDLGGGCNDDACADGRWRSENLGTCADGS
jgi:hypothetical protein